MNFLYLYRYCPDYNFDSHLHTDVVPFFEKAGHKCMAYGHRLHQGYDNSIVLQEWKKDTTLKELYEKYSFDVILLGTQSRMFLNYRPPLAIPHGKEVREQCILPPDFNSWKGKKVLLEEDFHYQDNTDWIKEVGIDLVLQRHYSNVERFKNVDKNNISCKWHPFSVDVDLFKDNSSISRKNKISLKASVVPHIYPNRQLLIDKLSPNYLDYNNNRNNYVNDLQSYVSHGCCSSVYDITPAKIFEICASGSLLFTNEGNYGLKELFDKDTFICYNSENMVQKAKMILNEPKMVKEFTQNARKCILERHTHEIRIKELVEIIERKL